MHMPRSITANSRAIAWTLALFMALSALYLARPMGSDAKSAADLQNSIARKQARSSALSSDIGNMSGKISGLRGRISKLQRRQDAIQADLDVKASRQKRIATDLEISRDRLARLKKQLDHSRKVLAARIVEVYKQGEPNMIEVVLNSRGFADMVERTTYMERIASQDHEIITTSSRRLRTWATRREASRSRPASLTVSFLVLPLSCVTVVMISRS